MATEQNTLTSSASASPVPIQHYREPRTFSAKAEEDVDEWLTHYERVSQYNNWNAASQLRNVVFFLAGTALVWYDNHADMLTTWTRFVEEIKKCFGDSDAKRKRAELTLAQRAQVPGETCTTYIEEILKLCRTVNPQMTEEDKVGHVVKGIAEDVYNFLIGKENLHTVSELIRHCRTFEALKTRRITPKFGRLANVTTVASVDTSPLLPDLSSAIRQIVREELQRHDEQARYAAPRCSSSVFRDTFREPPSATWNHSVNVADLIGSRDEPHYITTEPPRNDSPPQRFDPRPRNFRPRRLAATYDFQGEEPRYPQPMSSADYFNPHSEVRPSPVCYCCGMPGHIARYCSRRRASNYGSSAPTTRSSGRTLRTQWPGDSSSGSHFREDRCTAQETYFGAERTRNRYRSPASDRTLTPPPAFRASRSPSPRPRFTSPSPRRRFVSPPPGN